MKEFKIYKNPNEQEFAEISEAVKLNEGYCPCLQEKSEDTKCMCKDFRDSTDTDFCHCGRYYKVGNYETLAVIGDITGYNDKENYTNWCEMLMSQDFVVIGIPLSTTNPHVGSERFINMCRAIIAKSDALVVVDSNLSLASIIDDLCGWAEALGKKVLTREDLSK